MIQKLFSNYVNSFIFFDRKSTQTFPLIQELKPKKNLKKTESDRSLYLKNNITLLYTQFAGILSILFVKAKDLRHWLWTRRLLVPVSFIPVYSLIIEILLFIYLNLFV